MIPKPKERFLGDICDILDSKRKPVTKRDRVSGKYPYYGASGILDFVNEYIFDEKLVLIGEDGAKWEQGENSAFIAEGKYWVNNHAHVIRPNRLVVLDEWIVYFLNFCDLTKYTTGLTVPKLNQERLRSIKIPLPPLPEQQRIVDILDQSFAAIDQAIENTEKNYSEVSNLFQSAIDQYFQNPGNDWEVCKLEDYVRFIDYRGHTPNKTPQGMRLITAKNVKNGFLQIEPKEFVDPNIYYSWMVRGIPKKGDVLFTTEAPLANIAQLDTDNKVLFAQRIIILQPNHKKIKQTFLKYMLLSTPIRQRIFSKSTGATVQGIKSKWLKKIEIYFPEDLQLQENMISKLDSLWDNKLKLELNFDLKIKLLQELKQSILHKAFNGELT